MVILFFRVGHFMCIELCWTKCPARSELSAGHQQKSAGHVRHVRHISRSLMKLGHWDMGPLWDIWDALVKLMVEYG